MILVGAVCGFLRHRPPDFFDPVSQSRRSPEQASITAGYSISELSHRADSILKGESFTVHRALRAAHCSAMFMRPQSDQDGSDERLSDKVEEHSC